MELTNHEISVLYLGDCPDRIRPDLLAFVPVAATDIAAAIYTTWLELNDHSLHDMTAIMSTGTTPTPGCPQLFLQRNSRVNPPRRKRAS